MAVLLLTTSGEPTLVALGLAAGMGATRRELLAVMRPRAGPEGVYAWAAALLHHVMPGVRMM